MKPLLTIAFLFLFSVANCQHRPSEFVPAGILVGTFATIEFRGQELTQMQCQKVAITGFAVSIGVHYAIRAIKKHRNRKTKHTY